MSIPLLPPQPVGFPDPRLALDEPDGLLAAGGDLTNEWLIEAYSRGIFPWFGEEDDYILWWCPKNRAVIIPGEMKVSRSLSKKLRNGGFEVRMDTAFSATVLSCGKLRPDSAGTWITDQMHKAYTNLHEIGLAHSVETYLDGTLVGGLYGVSLGRFFFGESMFSAAPDASKVAFHALHQYLKQLDFALIDCQIQNPHLESLGVTEISRDAFLDLLAANPLDQTVRGAWQLS